MTKLIYALLVGIIGAIIVHICVVLMVPHFSELNTWKRLLATNNKYNFAPLSEDNPIVASTDPLFHLKACRFNLDDGPVHIKAEGTAPFWSMSVYDRNGTNFYSLNNHTMPNGKLDLVIGNPGQIMELKQSTPESVENSVLIGEDISDGFVILRSLKTKLTNNGDEFLDHAHCQTLDY